MFFESNGMPASKPAAVVSRCLINVEHLHAGCLQLTSTLNGCHDVVVSKPSKAGEIASLQLLQFFVGDNWQNIR